MTKEQSQIGVIGLGVMGRNLVLNIAEHGFAIAGNSYFEDTNLRAKNLTEKGTFHTKWTKTEATKL
jgi:6-phosphogluconate dehydrogenase